MPVQKDAIKGFTSRWVREICNLIFTLKFVKGYYKREVSLRELKSGNVKRPKCQIKNFIEEAEN